MEMYEHKHPKRRLMTPEGYAYHLEYDGCLWMVTLPMCPQFFGKTIGAAKAKLDNWLLQDLN